MKTLNILYISMILVGCQGNQTVDFSIVIPNMEDVNLETADMIGEVFSKDENSVISIGDQIGIEFNLKGILIENFDQDIYLKHESEYRLDDIAKKNVGSIEIFVVNAFKNCPKASDTFVCGGLTRHGGTNCGDNGYSCAVFCDRWIAIIIDSPRFDNTVLHEIGHLGGLDHMEDDVENLMYPEVPPDEFVIEDWQFDHMNKAFEKMDWACEHS